jgi:hypothetical protein
VLLLGFCGQRSPLPPNQLTYGMASGYAVASQRATDILLTYIFRRVA